MRGALAIRSMTTMGNHRVRSAQARMPRNFMVRQTALGVGSPPYADDRGGASARSRLRRGDAPVRGTKLYVLGASIALAIAVVVTFAASPAARRLVSGGRKITTTSASGSHHPAASRSGGATSGGARANGSAAASAAGGGPAAAGSAGAVRAVSPAIGLRPGAVSPSAAGLAAARAVVGKLSLTQLAGQRVIYSYSGPTPPAALLGLISRGEAAGVIFFADNIGTTRAQLANFASVVRELDRANAASTNPVRAPLLLMTDQEGGLVRRLPGAPVLSEKQVGQSAHPWAQASQAGASAAANLRHYGLNVNLAPVLGVYRHPGDFLDQFQRSYSMRAAQAAKLGSLFISAQQHGGVAATAKHFPGLGAATAYQNTDLRPVTLRLPLSELQAIDERPYPAAIAAGVKLVMVSWATYPALDPRHPAGLSPAVVGGQLRQRLGFAGVTITDALEAGALGPFGAIAHRATLAAHAGMDLLLCSEGDYREGVAAMNSLRYDYQHGLLGKQLFTAAAERVIALRATLPGA